MADFSTTFNPKIADFLAKYVDADGSEPSVQSVQIVSSGGESVQIVSSGGDSTSVELSMSTSLSEDGVQSTLSANTEINGTLIAATADAEAVGETASTLLNMEAQLSENSAEVEVVAEAEAEVEADAEVPATATVTTDVDASGFQFVNVQQSPPGGVTTDNGWEVTETGRNPVAVSGTYLEASNEPVALEQPSLTWEETWTESAPIIETGDVDLLLW